MLSVCCVRNLFTRLWSLILCIKSPISFVSKKDIGSFSNLMKKSLNSEMLMRKEIWSNNHLRIKSIAVRLIVSISCPNNISQTKPMSCFLMPTSTIDWVRNGKTNCKRLPTTKPSTICPKYLRYFFYIPQEKTKRPLFFYVLFFLHLVSKKGRCSFQEHSDALVFTIGICA